MPRQPVLLPVSFPLRTVEECRFGWPLGAVGLKQALVPAVPKRHRQGPNCRFSGEVRMSVDLKRVFSHIGTCPFRRLVGCTFEI
jgi:hypothetical protein